MKINLEFFKNFPLISINPIKMYKIFKFSELKKITLKSFTQNRCTILEI